MQTSVNIVQPHLLFTLALPGGQDATRAGSLPSQSRELAPGSPHPRSPRTPQTPTRQSLRSERQHAPIFKSGTESH